MMLRGLGATCIRQINGPPCDSFAGTGVSPNPLVNCCPPDKLDCVVLIPESCDTSGNPDATVVHGTAIPYPLPPTPAPTGLLGLDTKTWLYIGAGVLLLMMMGKK